MLRSFAVCLMTGVLLFPSVVLADYDGDMSLYEGEVPVEELDENQTLISPASDIKPQIQNPIVPPVADKPLLTAQTPPSAKAEDQTLAESLVLSDHNANTSASVSQTEDTKTEDSEIDEKAKTTSAPTLTATLKQNNKNPAILPDVKDTWVEKIATSNLLKDKNKSGDSEIEKLVNEARKKKEADNRRSNASVFDISGVMLRMSLKQTDRIMQNRGFRKIMQKYQIPNFIKWRNEETCRNNGVVGYERISSCVTDLAKKDGHQYVQVTKYVKYDTKEEVEVTFSSNFTDNKVIKIIYESQAAAIRGNSPKMIYLRNIKVYDFWKKINQKYGKPDDKSNVTWGMGGNKPFLKAKTGRLQLEDPMLRELDYTRMSREDQRYINTDLYSF